MGNFKYSPGLIGYGIEGKDGSTGLSGISLMFTDLDTINDVNTITDRISNNKLLWSSSLSLLPNGRKYQTGDLFIDRTGEVYEIDLSNILKFVTTNVNLSTSKYFAKSLGNKTYNLQERYSNIYDRYLIDSINTENPVDYSLLISKIYNIYPIHYTTIQYSDIDFQSYIPFSLYNSSNTSDNMSLSIVKESGNSIFHIGNTYNDQITARDVSLIIDVKKLRINKYTNNYFSETTEDETVLTNHEINSNNLFDIVFDTSPNTFIVSAPSSTSVDVSWNKYELIGTSDEDAVNNTIVNLYFYEVSTYNSLNYSFNNTKMPRCVLNNIDVSGKVTFSNLTADKTYHTYLEADCNGWVRKTLVRPVVPT